MPQVLLALVVGAACAAAAMAAAVASFDVNPAAPVLIALGAIAAGMLVLRFRHDAVFRGAGYGLITGALLAVLLWPLFDVSAAVG